jgi:hypothetical protein
MGNWMAFSIKLKGSDHARRRSDVTAGLKHELLDQAYKGHIPMPVSAFSTKIEKT